MAAIKFAEPFSPLFKPFRYKVFYGGRGSAKSWHFAKALLIQAAQTPLRILCAREVQKSIKQSVHQLLQDQIQALGLGDFYEVLETEIRGANGSLFIFAGLAQHTVDSIKSYEGCDVVWVEEAQAVSKRSWDVLIPTIRKPGSEIWVSFNPDLDTDDTWIRFVVNTPPNSVVVKVNHDQNPWFPAELEAERLHCLATDPRSYSNIWEGKTKAAVDGAIYADEIAAAQETGRVCNVHPDPTLKSHVIFDLGWNDSMAITIAQRMGSELRVVEYIEDSHKTLDYYSALLRERKLNWGTLWLPHDGAHKDYKYGKSAQEIMQALGWEVQIIPMADIEHGIKLARMAFPRVYFDKTHCQRLIECLKRYKRHVNQRSNEPGAPVHDEFSHGADNFRYLCSVADQMTNETWGGSLNYPRMGYA